MPVMPHHSTIWSFLPFHYCCQPVPAPFPSISQTTATLVSVHTSPSIKSYHQPEATLSLNTIPSITQTSSSPPFHAFPHLVHNMFDSKDTCVKCVLSSQPIHKSIQVFSVLSSPFVHPFTSSIPTCLYSPTLSPSPCRFIQQLFKVSFHWIPPPANPCSSLLGAWNITKKKCYLTFWVTETIVCEIIYCARILFQNLQL